MPWLWLCKLRVCVVQAAHRVRDKASDGGGAEAAVQAASA